MAVTAGKRIVLAEEKLASALAGLWTLLVDVSATSALPLCEPKLREGADHLDSADANYVRSERGLYAARQGAAVLR